MSRSKLYYLVVDCITFVDESFDAAPAAGLGFGPEAALLKGAEHDDSLEVVLQVLEDEAAASLDYALAHQSTANPEVRSVEANDSAVFELERGGAPQA